MGSTTTDRVLCLDFANTCGHRPLTVDDEIHEYADLVVWARRNALLSPAEASELSAAARARPGDAAAAHRRALELREVIYRLFSATARGEAPGEEDLAVVNRVLAGTRLRLRPSEGAPPCCGLEWTGEGDILDRVLWPVVRSTTDLLTSAAIGRVRECASETCSWLFVDRSRSGRRRWCDMRTCGNRAKARRYYRRHRETE
jgi:predicted RNA-binding Zn ribbon-like protein